jgi:hypothetical protein
VTSRVDDEQQAGWRDWVIVIVLSLTTILAAWSAFQSSKWSGMMSISLSQASSVEVPRDASHRPPVVPTGTSTDGSDL